MTAERFDDPRLTAMGLLIEVTGGMQAKLDPVFAAHGLSGNDFDVLIRLARSPGQRLRMTDLAAQTGLSTSGITRVVDRLQRQGLTRRVPSSADRRAWFVTLSSAGERRLAALVPEVVAEIERWLTGPLSRAQLDGLLAGLRQVRAAVRPGALAGAGAEARARSPSLPRPSRR